MSQSAKNVLSRREWLSCAGALGVSLLAPKCTAKPASVWVDERQVGSFVFRSTFPLSKAETHNVGLIELEAELQRILLLRNSRQPLEVQLFASEQEYLSVIQADHPKLSKRRALFIRHGKMATVYAYKQKELAVDLRHECTHALLHADLPNLPLWLDEGLAEYFEAPSSQRASGDSHLNYLRKRIDAGHRNRIVDLEQENEFDAFDKDDYLFAWAWVHFLLHGPKEASETLWQYLACMRSKSVDEPLSSMLAKASPRYEQQFLAHFKRWPEVLKQGNASPKTHSVKP